MRTIKFRAKRVGTHEWVYGHIFQTPIGEWKILRGFREYFIQPDTVGQFTGYTDYENREVYEGDIVELPSASINGHDFEHIQLSVVWLGDSFRLRPADRYYHRGACVDLRMNAASRGKVIGNIHDNPELLKKDKSD